MYYVADRKVGFSVRFAAMAQVVEHILGKDEVTSSNLVSSSMPEQSLLCSVFLFKEKHPAASLRLLFR